MKDDKRNSTKANENTSKKIGNFSIPNSNCSAKTYGFFLVDRLKKGLTWENIKNNLNFI